MTPSAHPTEGQAVRAAMEQMLHEAAQTGTRPSVLALARRVNMANTTLRRRYPEIAHALIRTRSAPPRTPETTTSTEDRLRARNAKLKRANRALADQLTLAAAHIQRLALDNDRLRSALEDSANVTSITSRATPPGFRR